jgi:mannan endo-1,4-beta-mannosidase
MTMPKLVARAVRCTIAAAVVAAVPACAAGRDAHLTTFHPRAHSNAPLKVNKGPLLNPKRKYYGIFVPNAPGDMSGITGANGSVTSETGKQPNLDLYFQAWDSGAASGTANFSKTAAENACAQGLLPLYTWESWDTADKGPNTHNGTSYGTGVRWAQTDFAPSKIAAGKYDAYIKATADRIKSLNCPLAMRFDQEFNGYWYPWGASTEGMPGSMAQRSAAYVRMWRHVWRIFQTEHATNVIWMWSPNIQSLKHPSEPALSANYPGDKFVDWVGLDGYYYDAKAGTSNDQSFSDVFKPTITQLKTAAPHKPWMVAETGVAAGTNKPAEITNLLHQVAKRKRFNGFVYFDQYKPNDRSDWRLDDTQASLDAFRNGVKRHRYAAGKPCTLSPCH